MSLGLLAMEVGLTHLVTPSVKASKLEKVIFLSAFMFCNNLLGEWAFVTLLTIKVNPCF